MAASNLHSNWEAGQLLSGKCSLFLPYDFGRIQSFLCCISEPLQIRLLIISNAGLNLIVR